MKASELFCFKDPINFAALLFFLAAGNKKFQQANATAISVIFKQQKMFSVFAQPDINSRQLCKPETKSRVCITVENSPNASSVDIRLCKHRKKVFYCFYKINFPRKNAKLFVWHSLRETLTSRKVLSSKSCTHNQFLFCKKVLSKIRTFLALTVSLGEKKNRHTFLVTIFQVSANEGMGK